MPLSYLRQTANKLKGRRGFKIFPQMSIIKPRNVQNEELNILHFITIGSRMPYSGTIGARLLSIGHQEDAERNLLLRLLKLLTKQPVLVGLVEMIRVERLEKHP